jgi:predicted  nucleic acid-binding Zn-ribbon protein
MAKTKTEIPRLTRTMVGKYMRMRDLEGEMKLLSAQLQDMDKERRMLSDEIGIAFGENTCMRLDGSTLLTKVRIECPEAHITRVAYGYTKWKARRG